MDFSQIPRPVLPFQAMKIRFPMRPCSFGLGALLGVVLLGCSGGHGTNVGSTVDAGATPNTPDALPASTDGTTRKDAPGKDDGPGGGKGSDALGDVGWSADSSAADVPPYTLGWPFGRLQDDLLGENYREWTCAVFTQANGQVVVVGTTELSQYFNGFFPLNSAITVVRLNADGKMDTSFGTAGKTVVSRGKDTLNNCRAAAQTKDGKIIVAGDSHPDPTKVGNVKTDGDFLVTRFNQDGTLDKTFGTDGFTTTTVHLTPDDQGRNELAVDMVLLDDGRIVVGGQSTDRDYGNERLPVLVRYTADGAIDPTFGVSGTAILSSTIKNSTGLSLVRTLLADKNGSVLVGLSNDPGWSTVHFVIARLLSDGTLDPAFATNGTIDEGLGPNGKGISLCRLSRTADGKLLATAKRSEGEPSLPYILIYRYTATGVADTTFGTAGQTRLAPAEAGIPTSLEAELAPWFVFAQGDGSILLGLSPWSPLSFATFDLIHVSATGVFDTAFGHLSWDWNTGTGATYDSRITAVGMFDNGDIVAAGAIEAGRDNYDNDTIVLHLKRN
jgi:uncharacterized delta-60 repeat protein